MSAMLRCAVLRPPPAGRPSSILTVLGTAAPQTAIFFMTYLLLQVGEGVCVSMCVIEGAGSEATLSALCFGSGAACCLLPMHAGLARIDAALQWGQLLILIDLCNRSGLSLPVGQPGLAGSPSRIGE